MDFAVLYQSHPKLFLWWRVSVCSVLRCVCPKAVEFSLARGIVTFHGSTCFKRSVSKKERNWRRRGRSWRDPAQTSLVFHPFTVTELFYQLNALNWPFMDRMRVRRAQPLPSHLFLFLPYSGFPDKLLAPIHTGWREALEVSCPLSIAHLLHWLCLTPLF